LNEFLTPGPGPYVLTHSVGCLPRAAHGALEAGYLEPWARRGGNAWPAWLERIDDFRAALARMFGGATADYCPQGNLSSGLAKVLSALPPDPRRRVLLASEESFPSLGFVLDRAARRGWTARFTPHRPDDIDAWSAALTSDVRAVLVTHVHSNSGRVAPVADIARLCAQRDLLCIVDVAQSAGILPLDFPTLGADVVLGSCVKWLCGGPGAGFLWIRPDLVPALEPDDVGWFSHADPFEMDIHSFRYAPDARRFWGGTPSVAPYVVAAASLRAIHGIGVDAILAHNRRLMAAFTDALPILWRARLPTWTTGGTLCIPLGASPPAVTAALESAGVQFDCRGDAVRISFHTCNSLDDAALVASAWHGVE
jgi:selenocysteine lyase/cysteine desulfurase